MKTCDKCQGTKFHKLGNIPITEYGDFNESGTWETIFTELAYDKYVFDTYICASCGKFFDDFSKPYTPFWHPV